MDIVTQSLLGGLAAQSVAKRKTVVLATLAGGFAGIVADFDFFIRSADDPLLYLDYHRYFSHALIFIPVGGLLAAVLLWPFLRRRLGFALLLLSTTVGYATSGVLDACTSYGTHLLWPFSEARIAWNIIAVIDPVFSLILLLSLILGLWQQRSIFARIGLLLAVIYLSIGWLQHERAESVMRQLAEQRGHVIERFVVKPTIANLLLWRSLYQAGGRYYVDALRVGINTSVYPGDSLPVMAVATVFPELAGDSVLTNDIQRFRRFSDGFLVVHPQYSDVIGDLRYAMLPNSLNPMWGISINVNNAQQHAPLHNYREFGGAERQQFWAMLSGAKTEAD